MQTAGITQRVMITNMRVVTPHLPLTLTIQMQAEGHDLALGLIAARVHHPILDPNVDRHTPITRQVPLVDVRFPLTETGSGNVQSQDTGQGTNTSPTTVATITTAMTIDTLAIMSQGSEGVNRLTISGTTNASAHENVICNLLSTLSPLARRSHRQGQALEARILPLHQWLSHHVHQWLHL